MTEKTRYLQRMAEIYDLPRIAEQANVGMKELKQIMLNLRERFGDALGGHPKFTGNNKVYKNGAIGFEVRCHGCRRTYYITNIPYGKCVDCAPGLPFRD